MVERFDLERFEWNAPDRLEVSGQFHGLQEPVSEPVLVVTGDGTPHRLQAAAESAPTDDGEWRAEFVWDGVPVGVDSAVLELGSEVVFDLPPPGKAQTPVASGVALQAQLLGAEQQAEELRAALERAEAELERARSDLESERAGRAADAQRFRDGLAQVQASAEQGLAAERSAVEQAGTEAGEVRDDAERLLKRLTGLVDALDSRN